MNSSIKDIYLLKDFETITSDMDCLANLRGSSILITGATGLIGSLLTRYFIYLNESQDAGIRIYIMVRSKAKAEGIFGDAMNSENLIPVITDITEPAEIDSDIDYVFHCASVTASKMMVEQPVETILTSVMGTHNLLEIARTHNTKSFVYVSSMEMYGQFGENQGKVTESDLGYVNPLTVRSNYPESKRMCENMCIAYLSEHGTPAKIARLAQTFGTGILPGEGRVFAQFARSAMEKKDIVLHTTGKSEGNYCYSADAVMALITILLKGTDGEAYNVCNEEMHTNIADMAAMVAEKIADGEIKLVFDIPESNTFGYAPETHMTLSSEKLRSLGWKPQTGIVDAYKNMMKSMAL